MTRKRSTTPGPAFGRWLATMITSRHWRQADLAKRMGVDQSMVSKWVRGSRIPDRPHCEGIARALALPEDEVLIQAGHLVPPSRPVASHPVRERLRVLIDVMDPEALEPVLAILERQHALTEALHDRS